MNNENGTPTFSQGGKPGIPSLNLQNLDPKSVQQEHEEKKAKKRGPKLDENLRLKICDLGNGCWTYH